jgi:hypothetical protein
MPPTYFDGGRQLIYPGTSFGTINTIGPKCNMKIVDAWWQDTGTTGTMSFQDAVGRVYEFTAASTGQPVAIGKLDWFEGPITFLATFTGTVYFILGNK